jgi:hypothetical protein
MRRHKNPLTPFLVEPLYRGRRSKGTPADNSAFLEEIITRHERKVEALFRHYRIHRELHDDPWKHLALRLAHDYVPGFRGESSSGAPTKWGPSELQHLREEVDALVAQGMSVEEACKRLAVARFQDAKFPQSGSHKTLCRRYYHAKDSEK